MGKDITRVTIFKGEEGAGGNMSDDLLTQKVFDNSITEEIRIYLQR
jgi:hypothetical protein